MGEESSSSRRIRRRPPGSAGRRTQGSFLLTDDKFTLRFSRTKRLNGNLFDWLFDVGPSELAGSRVTARPQRKTVSPSSWTLPRHPFFLADLASRGHSAEAVSEKAHDLEARIASGQWWTDLAPYKILIGCHYSGAKNKNERGDLRATTGGLEYKAVLGTKVKIPWCVVRDIEVGTQATKRVSAGRVLAVGVFALAAKKHETWTYVHVADQNTVWSFATKADQGKVVKALQPILTLQPSSVCQRRGAAAASRRDLCSG